MPSTDVDQEQKTQLPSVEKTPAKSLSGARAILISTLIVLTQLVQMIPLGTGIGAAVTISEDVGVDPTRGSWIAASYPLTQGAFVLIGGRIGSVYGHKNTLLAAGIWWITFSLISGFMTNFIALCVLRGLTGIGGAFMVPNAIALLTINFPPGKLRNITVAFFGAMAPIGAAGGGIFAGFFVQLTQWKWLFFFLAILGAFVFTAFALVVPGEPEPFDKDGKIDYVGAYLGVGGLILFNFAWKYDPLCHIIVCLKADSSAKQSQAPAVGWKEPYEYSLLIVSILHILAFIFWEWKVAKEPIMPLTIWAAPSFGLVILVCFLTIMAVGIVLWYVTLYNQVLRHYTIFASAATYVPLAVMGAVAAFLSSWAVSRLPAQYILACGSLASCGACILVATSPARQIYWAQLFPAMILTAFGPDLIFTASQIIASNSVRRDQQGIAGSLMGTTISYGLSTGLGFAGTVERYTNDGGTDIHKGYSNALWLGVGMSGLAALIALTSVRVPKDEREGWDEDDTSAPVSG
ncbi:putative MFS-type transporter [Hyphodiscus hymeniophilus]|uniref:MFS-type transporter n=1 Tax=Hyphodiscus hymeniophilus TaxID=353542 RepID=A0A9P7AXN4_9HELO|nr:putative MFS-type transporter [Hyphodiscus hymeniophilus]